MSKNSGMGSKRDGSHTNKGLGKCSDKHSHQCGSGMDLNTEHYEFKNYEHKHKKHDFEKPYHQNVIKHTFDD